MEALGATHPAHSRDCIDLACGRVTQPIVARLAILSPSVGGRLRCPCIIRTSRVRRTQAHGWPED
jgi:hypothetical protein